MINLAKLSVIISSKLVWLFQSELQHYIHKQWAIPRISGTPSEGKYDMIFWELEIHRLEHCFQNLAF